MTWRQLTLEYPFYFAIFIGLKGDFPTVYLVCQICKIITVTVLENQVFVCANRQKSWLYVETGHAILRTSFKIWPLSEYILTKVGKDPGDSVYSSHCSDSFCTGKLDSWLHYHLKWHTHKLPLSNLNWTPDSKYFDQIGQSLASSISKYATQCTFPGTKVSAVDFDLTSPRFSCTKSPVT